MALRLSVLKFDRCLAGFLPFPESILLFTFISSVITKIVGCPSEFPSRFKAPIVFNTRLPQERDSLPDPIEVLPLTVKLIGLGDLRRGRLGIAQIDSLSGLRRLFLTPGHRQQTCEQPHCKQVIDEFRRIFEDLTT